MKIADVGGGGGRITKSMFADMGKGGGQKWPKIADVFYGRPLI